MTNKQKFVLCILAILGLTAMSLTLVAAGRVDALTAIWSGLGGVAVFYWFFR